MQMEGYLLVPPDRPVLLGRTVWKTRFVVLGTETPRRQPTPTNPHPPSSRLQSSLKQLKFGTHNVSLADLSEPEEDGLHLFIYKQQGDAQPLARHSLNTLRSCGIENVTYRQTNTIQQTLVLKFEADPVERNRNKLRSEKAGRARQTPRLRTSTIHFRDGPESATSISIWHEAIQTHCIPEQQPSHFDSTVSLSDPSSRPSTATARANGASSQGGYHCGSGKRPPALTNICGHASNPPLSSPHAYSPTRANQLSDASSQMTEDRGTSTSSDAPSPIPSPKQPRETILDRAFQMNCIPGAPLASDADWDGGISSIAKFEALMEQADAKALRERRHSSVDGLDGITVIPTSAQRALEYIASGATASKPRMRPGRSRPTSMALPLTSSRTSFAEDTSERRRSSVSITPSTSTIGRKHKSLSIADVTNRLSSASSRILARTNTASSERSSWGSEGSFGCSGEDGTRHHGPCPFSARPAWGVSGELFGV